MRSGSKCEGYAQVGIEDADRLVRWMQLIDTDGIWQGDPLAGMAAITSLLGSSLHLVEPTSAAHLPVDLTLHADAVNSFNVIDVGIYTPTAPTIAPTIAERRATGTGRAPRSPSVGPNRTVLEGRPSRQSVLAAERKGLCERGC